MRPEIGSVNAGVETLAALLRCPKCGSADLTWVGDVEVRPEGLDLHGTVEYVGEARCQMCGGRLICRRHARLDEYPYGEEL